MAVTYKPSWHRSSHCVSISEDKLIASNPTPTPWGWISASRPIKLTSEVQETRWSLSVIFNFNIYIGVISSQFKAWSAKEWPPRGCYVFGPNRIVCDGQLEHFTDPKFKSGEILSLQLIQSTNGNWINLLKGQNTIVCRLFYFIYTFVFF